MRENRISVGMLLVGALVYCSTISVFAAEPAASTPAVVLSSGTEEGGYWNAGERLQATAKSEVGLAVENLPSTGSLENLERLLDPDSPVNLAFAQADAAQYYLNKRPGEVKKLDLLENIGEECVYIITGSDSKISTEDDIRDGRDLHLGIRSPSSGMAATFDYMVSQMPEMADITIDYGDTSAWMSQLNTEDVTVDAIMMVHRPREHSVEVDTAVANPDAYRFVELSNDHLSQELWNGRKIYRNMKIMLPGAKKPVKTICVLGLLLGNKQKLSVAQRNQLNELVTYHWMKVYVTQ